MSLVPIIKLDAVPRSESSGEMGAPSFQSRGAVKRHTGEDFCDSGNGD